MEQPTSLSGVIEEIQDLKIEVIALRVLVNSLKKAIELSDPRMTEAFAVAKGEFLKNLPTDTDGSRKLVDRLRQMTQDW
jgi:hypothetical protein